MRVEVLSGPWAERLRQLDESSRLTIEVVDRPGVAALVIGPDESVADVVVDSDAHLDQAWRERIEPMALILAGLAVSPPSPAVLREHDPRYGVIAGRLLNRLRAGLLGGDIADESWTFDHIGSTSVPGLRAKPYVDLQLGVDPLPEEGSAFDAVLAAVGFLPATGSRPDSPGVHRDWTKDPDLAPAEAYRKRLYVRPDPGGPSILHVRRLGGPWWSYAVLFRDWLRADAAGRRAYEETKLVLAAAHADDADYDDYTRAKAAFFDQVQQEYESYGAASPYRLWSAGAEGR